MKLIKYLLVLFFACSVEAESVLVSWLKNPEPDITGYSVYYRNTKIQQFTSTFVTNISCQIDGLSSMNTYVFYVTDWNTSKLESDPSDSVTYTVPPKSATNLRIIDNK